MDADQARFFRRQTGAETGDASLELCALEVVRVSVEGDDGAVRELDAAGYLFDDSDAGDLAQAEAGIIEHVNGGHPDTIHAVVSHRGLGADDWVLIGVDPEGIDLARGSQLARVALNKVVKSREEFKYTMIELRAQGGGVMPPAAEAAQ